jgi:hypothetical protein
LNLNTFVISAFVCVFCSLFIVTHLSSLFVILAFIFAINAPFCWHQASFKKKFFLASFFRALAYYDTCPSICENIQ